VKKSTTQELVEHRAISRRFLRLKQSLNVSVSQWWWMTLAIDANIQNTV
jgi:hypothetical protein